MKNFHNYKNILPYTFFIVFLLYLFANTGIHGDDYALIKELQGKRSLFILSAENLGKYIYNIPSYLIWCSYSIIGYENLYLYDLLKYLLNLISIYFLYSFFINYFSELRSFIISFLIILFPTHDSSNYWLMATPLYVFFPSMIFFSFSLIKKNSYLLGSIFLLIASFNYTSPPYILGLSVIFLLEKNYKKLMLFFFIGSIYVLYYLIISKIYGNLEHRVDDYLNIYKIVINFSLQLITSIDANIGISFVMKVFYSILSINIIGISIIFLFILSFYICFKDKILVFEKTSDKNKIIVVASMVLIYFFSLIIFSLTSSYPQTTFNLGNRTTIYSSFVFVVVLSIFIKRNTTFLIITLILMLSIVGISNHWKEFNKKNINIINQINSNKNFEDLNSTDIIMLKDNLYSKFGKISHIEFLIVPWVSNQIFSKYENFTVLPLSKYLYIDNNVIINKKEGTNHTIVKNIYIYKTESNELILIKRSDIMELISNEESILRHWVQLKEFELLSTIIIKFFPRVNYLFIK